MKFLETLEFNPQRSEFEAQTGFYVTWKQTVLWLIFLTIVAFGLRVVNLNAVGFAEDEVHKIEAVASYRTGDFTPNAEHPMLMKLAMMVSVRASEVWNEHIPEHPMAVETALRLPNCLLGALTTFVLGLLAAELFSPVVGVLTGALWATGILAIATNRIGKEDTFLVFFLWLAYFAYFHAKKMGTKELTPTKRAHQAWWYTLSGASFGLMLASKYFPHYWGLLFLWEYIDHKLRPENPLTNPIPRFVFPRFYAAMLGSFLVANPVVWLPSTLTYMANYIHEDTVTHHGYLLMGTLFLNNPSRTAFSGGLPLYFYPLMIAVKTAPAILVGLVVGGWVTLRNAFRQSTSFFLVFMLGFWLVPFSIIGGKWMRYSLSVLPMVYMVAAIGMCQCALFSLHGFRLVEKVFSNSNPRPSTLDSHLLLPKTWLPITMCALMVMSAFMACVKRAPFYSLYVNELGGGEVRAGYYFPHDEFYDAGMREALALIARTAPLGATVVTETPGLVRYYTTLYHRTDLTSAILSDTEFQLDSPGRKYVIVQLGRRYFENSDRMDRVLTAGRLYHEVRVAGHVAVQVYLLEGTAFKEKNYLVSTGSGREPKPKN